jgi:hypothetical protein
MINQHLPSSRTLLPSIPLANERRVDHTTGSTPATPTRFIDALKFWHRYTWRDFYFEYAVLAFIIGYYTLYSFGRKRNSFLAQTWIRTNRTLLTEQFAQFGIPSKDDRIIHLSHDGAGVFESYATGRVGVNRLWIEMRMVNRHDVLAWIVESVGGWLFDWFPGDGEDVVEVTIEPNVEWESFTWGVVRRGKMRKLKESRYDLVISPLFLCCSCPWLGLLRLLCLKVSLSG